MKNLLSLVAVLASLLTLSGCLTYNDMQTGRTVDAKTNELSFAANLSYQEKIEFEEEDGVKEKTVYPSLTANYRRGISDKSDFGISANSNGNINLDIRRQLLGGKESPFAMSVGVGVGGIILYLGQLATIQSYISYYPSENLSVTWNPRLIGIFELDAHKKYESFALSNNLTILIGKKTQFGTTLGLNYIEECNCTQPYIGLGIKKAWGK